MKFQPFAVLFVTLATAGVAVARLSPEQLKQLPPPVPGPVDFARDIRPIFEASCIKCHGRGHDKGDFRIDNRDSLLKGGDSGVAVVPGKSAESLLIEMVSGLDPENVMPVKGSRLTARQVGLLRAWIDQGATWDASITFAKLPPKNLHPRQPELPPAAGAHAHPVDRLLFGYFKQHSVTAPALVDDRTFARRVSLDLTGLLPSPDELDDLLRDSRQNKRELLVDRLLADKRRYAEHWLTFWNDLLRNDYRGTGYIDKGRKPITDWLYGALATNLPFNRFVSELVNPSASSEGFAHGIVWRGAINSSQTPPMQAAQNISQVFMGVNVKCASCHDSFINDWTLADAYGMAAVYADGPLEMFKCDKPTGKTMTARFLYPELGDIKADAPKAERMKRLADLMTGQKNGRLTRTIVNRLWARFMGRGLVEPLDDMEQSAWHPDLLDWLAEDLASHGYDLKHTMRTITTSAAYQWPAVSVGEQQAGADFVFRGPAIRRMNAEQFRDALGTLTGVWYDKPDAKLESTKLGQSDAPVLPRPARWVWNSPDAATKAMAETVYFRKTFTLPQKPEEAWVVASCDNSFTVYVNGHKAASGRDFTQPNFADVRAHLKPGENVIAVAGVNHRPDNTAPLTNSPPVAAEANPAGLVLYAWLRHGKEVLDFATDASWKCSQVRTPGWEKPKFDASAWSAASELGPVEAAPWNLGAKLAQAMSSALVHGEVRSSLVAADPLAVALGRPNREQVTTFRPSSATTLQALELTNGDTLSGVINRGAAKLLATNPVSSETLVHQVFNKALGRKPTASEQKLAVELVGQPARKEGVEDLLWAVTMLPEFQLIY